MRYEHLTQHAAIVALGLCLALLTLAGSVLPISPIESLVALGTGLLPGVP
jgi:hypothetical protein